MRSICFVALLLNSLVASANISAPPEASPGQITGGPFISSHCIITSELLEVDLRPLENLENGIVNAIYDFTCDTLNESLELVFVARNLSDKNFVVKLDGNVVLGDTINLSLVPEHWLIPRKLDWGNGLVYDSTNWRFEIEYHYYSNETNDYILFRISIDSGDHVLNVTYEVEVPQDFGGTTIEHCFTYILSPALDWKEYHDLSLKVHVPEEWTFNTNLEIIKSEDGNTGTGHWKNVPADYFYVITSLPDDNANLIQGLYFFGLTGLLIISIFWCIYRMCIRRFQGTVSPAIFWTFGLWFMLLVGIVFIFIVSFRGHWMSIWYADQLEPGYTHGDAYSFLFVPVIWIFGVPSTWVIQFAFLEFVKWRKSKS